MSAERRQYLRVIFEETIQVRTEEWTDPIATGLDISLNGVRFHCEYPLSDGERVIIQFQPDFELEGVARWCWPIEWYYQAAVQFADITLEQQEQLRQYIRQTTGEEYPDYGATEPEDQVTQPEIEEDAGFTAALEDDELPIDLDDDGLESEEETDEEGGLRPQSYAGQNIALFIEKDSPHADMMIQYLADRTAFEVNLINKPGNLWPMLREHVLDLVVINQTSTNEEDADAVMETLRHDYPEVPYIVLAGPVSLEQRLRLITKGAADVITRPVHLSAIAQSILLQFHANQAEGSSLPAGLLDDNLDISNELDLMESEF